MKVYGTLIHQWNSIRTLMGEQMLEAIKRHHGGVVMDGYDPQRYVACIVFASKDARDKFGWELDRMGITFDTRDDGYIDDKFAEGWK